MGGLRPIMSLGSDAPRFLRTIILHNEKMEKVSSQPTFGIFA